MVAISAACGCAGRVATRSLEGKTRVTSRVTCLDRIRPRSRSKEFQSTSPGVNLSATRGMAELVTWPYCGHADFHRPSFHSTCSASAPYGIATDGP
ncbi:hypothetical protein BD310DRAFT_310232 [Dichomitus squalens]|uniref:Uncharacterized protein n=1 Tax=Dichomitus squalens TaxID=114155 RepID=A0A4Q9Q0K8_9APHY|nr:hypothetical protein BD310DRAFT_310232 [Dichomitus squalens]